MVRLTQATAFLNLSWKLSSWIPFTASRTSIGQAAKLITSISYIGGSDETLISVIAMLSTSVQHRDAADTSAKKIRVFERTG